MLSKKTADMETKDQFYTRVSELFK